MSKFDEFDLDIQAVKTNDVQMAESTLECVTKSVAYCAENYRGATTNTRYCTFCCTGITYTGC